MQIDDEPVRPPRAPAVSREARQTLVACLVLLVLFGLVALFGNGIVPANFAANPSAIAERSGTGDGDDDLRTGSILFVPDQGNVCRKRVIDNATWRIHDGGAVVCNEAVSWNANAAGSRNSPIARIEAIRDGFQPKK